MKKLAFVFTLPVVLLLFGCPVGIDYPPGTPGKEKINPVLLGHWVSSDDDPEFKEAKLVRNDDFSYQVTILEKGTMYSLEDDDFKGWHTEIDGLGFIYIKPDDEEKFYCYGYKMSGNNELKLYSAALLDGGVDAVTSTETFRKQLAVSIKKPEWFEEGLTFNRQ
ncbi:MAG: hypothetical protein MH137_10240 [Flavobacteriales bacterium]|nr:hypothetical protein [Flavobacteriales bacterium]